MENLSEKVVVVLPAFNEAEVIEQVVSDIRMAGFDDIVVVDDGSEDETHARASKGGAIAARHLINRGKGAAVRTGTDVAKSLEADIIVTMDGDGQHNPHEIRPMVELIKNGHDVVLGTRMKNTKGMPPTRILANFAGNILTWILFGIWISDSQSGFRAYSRKALEAIDTKSDRYEYDSEVAREIKLNQLKYTELPIEALYSQYSTNKKNKQNFTNGIKTIIKMFLSV